MDSAELLVPLGFFAAIVLSLYFYYKARNKERMALIENGLWDKKPGKKTNYSGFKAGMFFIGLAVGIFIGYLLGEFTGINEVVAFFSMILLFGGASLILTNFITIKKEQESN